MDLVKGLGADRVIDYTTGDFTKDGHTDDVVLDCVGKSSFSRCRPLLKPAGIYNISSELGPHAQNPFRALLAPFRRGKRVLFPIPHHDQEMIGYLKGLLESGEFKPDRPNLSVGPHRRGLPVRRDRAEDRQRRHHH